MVPFRNAASRAMGQLGPKTAAVMEMFQSENFKSLIEKLDTSLPEQKTAMGNIGAWLKEYGIKVPRGVSFSVNADKVRMTIEVSVREANSSGK